MRQVCPVGAPAEMARFMPASLMRQPNFAALVALVWLLVALALLLLHWPQTAETLLDTDDAMRLTELRAWLAGQSWFDLSEARLQPPIGYESHWSRLIDAGLAGMLLLFNLFVDQADAERLMRAWWPLVWLLPTIAGMTAIAWRIAGHEAAKVALLLAMVGVPAYQQFMPGRIDHHNVQIALTLMVVAATVWSDRKPWTATAAGALSGFALTIGFESVPYLAVCGAAFALRYVFDRKAATLLRGYGLALAASAIVGFLVSVGPQHWERSQCDAIAINNCAAVVCAGLVLALAGWLAHAQAVTRVLAVTAAASSALAVLLWFDKRCIGGPFAMVDPAIWPIWHDHVRELQPLVAVFRLNPLTAAGIVAFPAVALLAALLLAGDRVLRRDFGFLAAALVFCLAAVTMLAAIRAYSYAIWLGMPLVAALAPRLFTLLRLKTAIARFAAALLLTPMALSSGAIGIAHAAGLDDTDSFARPASRHCFRTENYAPLARVPKGLVVTDISYGPYLLALTPHSVLAAPYHRLSTGITTAHRALAAPPEQARQVLQSVKATYVLVCGPRPPDGLAEPERGRSLWGRLRAGAVPDWLEPVPVGAAFALYRVRP
jgi:hypothetical protein